MGKSWSLLFGVVLTACFLLFVIAPIVGWWLPQPASEHAWGIDVLFYLILGVTGFFFVVTEAVLVVFMWKYGEREGGTSSEQSQTEGQNQGDGFLARLCRPITRYLNTQHRVEMAWTIVPGIILFLIAVAQIPIWAEAKYRSHMPTASASKSPVHVAVSARQFEWRIRYPSPARYEAMKSKKEFDGFAKHPHQDDVYAVNELHIIKAHPVLVQLSTRDVLHSFNIPVMRVKQDALPGKVIPVWFTPTRYNTVKKNGKWIDAYNPDGETSAEKYNNKEFIWEIACAELCGWGHYRMLGRVYVHPDEASFLAWLQSAYERQNFTGK